MKINKWAVTYGCLLTAYTLFTLLDAFVIPHDIVALDDLPQAVVTTTATTTTTAAMTTTSTETLAPETSAATTETTAESTTETAERSYTSENISITITEFREYDTTIYAADVVISDPSYLRTGLADNSFGCRYCADISCGKRRAAQLGRLFGEVCA